MYDEESLTAVEAIVTAMRYLNAAHEACKMGFTADYIESAVKDLRTAISLELTETDQ